MLRRDRERVGVDREREPGSWVAQRRGNLHVEGAGVPRVTPASHGAADSAARLFYNRERGSCEALKRYLQAGLLALVDLDSEGGKESNQSAVTMWSQQPYCGICFALGTDKELVPCFGCGSAPLCKECREAGGAAVKRGLHVNHTEKQCRMCCPILPQTPSQPRPGRAPPRALSPQPLAGTSSRPHVSE